MATKSPSTDTSLWVPVLRFLQRRDSLLGRAPGRGLRMSEQWQRIMRHALAVNLEV